jgi:hypothetical protein
MRVMVVHMSFSWDAEKDERRAIEAAQEVEGD